MSQKFGEVSYEDYPELTTNFVSKLQDDKIMGSACSECDEKYFPPRTACTNFHSPNSMEFFPLDTLEGEVKAFTVIRFAPDSHADKAPYLIAIADLDGFRVLAHLVGMTSLPKVGMKVRLKTQSVSSDRATYKFVKA